MNPCAVDFNLDVGGDPAAALRRGIDQVIATAVSVARASMSSSFC